MHQSPIDSEQVPFLRQTLFASDDVTLQQAGQHGKLLYLTLDEIKESSISIYEQLADAAESRMRHGKGSGFLAQRDALRPYVGTQLLRAGMWHSDHQYEVYVDPVGQKVVHLTSVPSPDPDGPSAEECERMLAGGSAGLFTQYELDQQYPALGQVDELPVEAIQVVFTSTESRSVIHHADTFPYFSLSHFWINSRKALDAEYHPDLDNPICEEISEDEFMGLLARCLVSRIFSAKLSALGEFELGQWMKNEWNQQWAVAEIGGEYYAAYWETSG